MSFRNSMSFQIFYLYGQISQENHSAKRFTSNAPIIHTQCLNAIYSFLTETRRHSIFCWWKANRPEPTMTKDRKVYLQVPRVWFPTDTNIHMQLSHRCEWKHADTLILSILSPSQTQTCISLPPSFHHLLSPFFSPFRSIFSHHKSATCSSNLIR